MEDLCNILWNNLWNYQFNLSDSPEKLLKMDSKQFCFFLHKKAAD